MQHAVYLDHNATTCVRPAAAAAVADVVAAVGNPSSVHRFGRLARRCVEDAREAVAALAGVRGADVVFTSGGTEANVLALQGCGRERVIVSSVEHASVLEAAAQVDRIAVDHQGRVDVDALEDMLGRDPRPTVVAVMLANNETGVLQRVADVVAVARRHGALVHCDAVQAAGKVPVDAEALGVDTLALSGHKVGAPMGTGALVDRTGAVSPILRGGGQERRRRAGTENVPGIAGFGAAASTAAQLTESRRLQALRDNLERRVLKAVPSVRVFGGEADRLPNTSCLGLPDVSAETQVISLDLAGVAVGAGAACSSGKVAASHVLAAMGVPPEEAATAIRVSLGWTTTADDVDRFIESWTAVARRRGVATMKATAVEGAGV